MQHRPEYRLDRLRMIMLDESSSSGRHEGEPKQWLRTMVVDLSHTADADVDKRLTHQLLGGVVGCAVVERVVCKDLLSDHLLSRLLPFLTQSVSMLTTLDLRGVRCDIGNAFFLAIADAHSSSLRRLYLPWNSSVAQSTLDRFTQLEELDASWCLNLTNVDFCSATLRVLYAKYCRNLTDAGLRKATRLEVLHVGSCWQVTDVSPFTHCLLELDASGGCGIGSAALSECHRLQVLNAAGNDKITTLRPFAQRLKELNAGSSTMNDATLSDATGLVSLSVDCNNSIITVAPFGASLRRLGARCSMIGDAGLVTATNLVYLGASCNNRIHSLAPFSASLLELDVSGNLCQIDDAALSATTNLICLNVSQNKKITTVQSCGRSLRHLRAWGCHCALTNEGLSTATQLVTLRCRGNPNLTTMEPFLHSLEELVTDSPAMLQEVGSATQLHCVRFHGDVSVDRSTVSARLKAYCFVQKNDSWVRNVSSSWPTKTAAEASSPVQGRKSAEKPVVAEIVQPKDDACKADFDEDTVTSVSAAKKTLAAKATPSKK